MTGKQRKRWIPSPSRPSILRIPEQLKTELEAKACRLIEDFLKPKYVHPPSAGRELNYIVDFSTKWYRNYFYFCAKYCSPGPHAIAPFFEIRFARLEYIDDRRFNLSYMRFTEEWVEVYPRLSMEDCLRTIRDDPLFTP
jgi:hypothetical protein